MVHYELALILRSVPKEKFKNVLKTTATIILEEGALLRQLQNLGERKLPYRMRAHQQWFNEGRYLVCDMEAGPQMAKQILQRLRETESIIRASLIKL